MGSNDRMTNKLLLALPKDELERLAPSLEFISFARGEVLYDAGQRIRYAYFLNKNTLASVVFTMESGASLEVDLVGSEGLVSIQTFLGPEVYPGRVVIQVAGSAMRIRADDLRRAFNLGGFTRNVLLRYTQAVITQIAQTAACNHLHSVEERLSRWLLTINDRVDGDIPLTHEVISRRLGTHRSSVNEAAAGLQRRGVIRYVRGNITVLHREELRSAACECYDVIRRQFDTAFA